MKLDLFYKYLGDTCSSDQVDEFFHWLKNEADDIDLQFIMNNYWKSIKNTIPENEGFRKQRLDAIHHTINLRSLRTSASRKKRKLVQFLARAVAILLIPVLTILVYKSFFEQGNKRTLLSEPVMNEIVSPIGSRTSLSLSDGTKVWLNYGSSLIYPQQFTGKKRVVQLKGEGYFQVVNASKPFVVKTELVDVVTVGTAFNVKAYETDKTVETTLENGKIYLKNELLDEIEMYPGQHCKLNKELNDFTITEVDIDRYIAWKDGKLIFYDDNIVAIADRLSRWYNVEIVISDPRIKELTYTGTFIDEPLYQILEMLEVVSPVQFVIQKRQKNKDGTYAKRRIIAKFKDQ